MVRWSQNLIPTLRDNPQEAEIASHQLMLRAGLIRKLAGGLYTFLPLGLRALRKVEQIVRQEMDRAGALEILMPALQPREIWERSRRYGTMGPVMFRLKDRQDREMVLGPTHEEVVTDLAAHELRSYRDLPRTFYQIQTKFRDEIRPRFGLMRAKEFIMKDAYSFDIGWSEADGSYQAMYDAYTRIFERCGIRTKVVEADTGAMGGKWSHEFMVLADAGEDGIVECDSCAYAANLEKAERTVRATTQPSADSELKEVSTPNKRTIEEVASFLKVPADRLIKTLIYLVNGAPVAVLCAGDREVNPLKLGRALDGAECVLADDETVRKVSGAPVGFAGPQGLSVPVYADMALKGMRHGITGANKADTHVDGLSLDRDVRVNHYFDLCFARKGDLCPRCPGGHLVEKRGIEVGHVFKLGTKYSETLEAYYLDAEGQKKPAVMGCYGIGVTRTLQAVIEQNYDDKGIRWPLSVAPYRVALLMLDPQDPSNLEAANTLVAGLEARGIDTIVDDRPDRPGVKFNDADLVGFPVRVVVSRKSLAKGCVEVKRRDAPAPEFFQIADAADKIGKMAAV